MQRLDESTARRQIYQLEQKDLTSVLLNGNINRIVTYQTVDREMLAPSVEAVKMGTPGTEPALSAYPGYSLGLRVHVWAWSHDARADAAVVPGGYVPYAGYTTISVTKNANRRVVLLGDFAHALMPPRCITVGVSAFLYQITDTAVDLINLPSAPDLNLANVGVYKVILTLGT